MGMDITKDERGGRYNCKYTTSDREKIVQFINLLPKDQSHYGRKDSDKEYLSSDLTFRCLHEEFTRKNPEIKMSVHFFIRIFKEHFPNLSFHRPRVDTCNTCDKMASKLKGSNSGSKEEMIARKNLSTHNEEADLARSAMKIDKLSSDPNVTCLSIDLQQVIPLPTMTHGEMFYLRQLSCYNLGIHVDNDDHAFMCIWHEAVASRGALEIASCLFDLYNHETRPPLKKKLIVWSDNCPGQNKNKIIIMAYMLMIHWGLVESVEHKFLVSGHSFLSCDRDFALIEKKKRKRILYDLEDVDKLITESRKNPFAVRKMANFFDFRNAADWFLNTTKLALSSVCWFRITCPGKIEVKRHFKQNNFETFNIWKRGRTATDLDNYEFTLMGSRGLTKEKKADLRKFIHMLPEDKKAFFEDLL